MISISSENAATSAFDQQGYCGKNFCQLLPQHITRSPARGLYLPVKYIHFPGKTLCNVNLVIVDSEEKMISRVVKSCVTAL